MARRVKGVKKRPRKSAEVAGKLQSIRNFCLTCMAFNASEVERCTASDCWLFPWRFGTTPELAERQGKEAGL